MIRAFLTEYKDGVLASLQGFLVLHKLDNLDGNQAVETRRSSKDVISKQTVLENRRKKHMESKSIELPQKEIAARRISTIQRVFRCVCINICSVLLVMLLTWLFNQFRSTYFSAFIRYFGSLLLLPIFLSVRLLSTLWFADVAGAAYRYRRLAGHPVTKLPPDFSRAASDFVHAILVELVFLAQALAIIGVGVPLLSPLAGFVYMSLLHSLYSFDYIWMSSGVSMNARLAMVERRWPYHLGFGTLLTVGTSLSTNFVINGCVFGALFPFFIVSSFLADGQKATGDRENGIPPVHFYYLAQQLTNKLSLIVFGRMC